MLYLISNIVAWTIVIIFVVASYYLTYYWQKEVKSLLTIVVVSFFVAISVVLTNFLSYNLYFFPNITGIKFSFGSFIIFLIGMLFGPFFGSIAGVAADSIGSMVNISGGYCAIFTLDATLYGFVGSLVFLIRKTRFWYILTVFLFVILFAFISFGLDLWYSYITFGTAGLVSSLIIKLIKFPIEVVVYLISIFSFFVSTHYLLNLRFILNLWCDRYGQLFLHKNLKEKKLICGKQ